MKPIASVYLIVLLQYEYELGLSCTVSLPPEDQLGAAATRP